MIGMFPEISLHDLHLQPPAIRSSSIVYRANDVMPRLHRIPSNGNAGCRRADIGFIYEPVQPPDFAICIRCQGDGIFSVSGRAYGVRCCHNG